MPQVNRLSLVVRLPDLAYHDEVTPAHPGVYVAVPDLRLYRGRVLGGLGVRAPSVSSG
jgi:hypothetical protein